MMLIPNFCLANDVKIYIYDEFNFRKLNFCINWSVNKFTLTTYEVTSDSL